MLKFDKEIEELIAKRHLLPDDLWKKTDGETYEVIWFMDRQKPSVEADYDFDEERFGMTKDGKVIWGFDSGCSCPSPWSRFDFGDANYKVKEWKEFVVSPETAFDAGWEDDCYDKLKELLKMI
jgi:hypothetical protein